MTLQGKSFFVKEFIRHREKLLDKKMSRIIYAYGSNGESTKHQEYIQELISYFPELEFGKGLPDVGVLCDENTLVIICMPHSHVSRCMTFI